jgi:hypothetical protein
MNAVLFVGDPPLGGDAAVADPATKRKATLDTKTINCYVRYNSPTCLPLTVLKATVATGADYGGSSGPPNAPTGVDYHVVDSEFIAPPQYSHFMSIDHGDFVQFGMPKRPPIDPDFDVARDMHPHTNALHLELDRTIIST